MMIRHATALAATTGLCIFGAGCAAGNGPASSEEHTAQAAAPLTSTAISNDAPDGIVYSTGNVYFTTHRTGWVVLGSAKGEERDPAIRFPPVTTSYVLRTGKYSVPGQEITLWSEQGSRFGDIVWALVGGNYYGYFLSENLSTAQVTIKRVPLAGGTAVDIAGGIGNDIDIVNGHHLLDTDGVNLFWQDATTVYKMPIGGGTHTVVDTLSPNTPTAGVYVVGGNVYYASSTTVRQAPTSGFFSPQTIVNSPTRIVALSAAMYGSNPMVAWGTQDGWAQFLLTGVTLGIKQPDGFMPTSLAPAFAESFAYTACTSTSCEMNGSGNTIASGAFGIQVDTSTANFFWGDSTGIYRSYQPVIW